MAKLNARIRAEEAGSDGRVNIKIRLSHKGATRYIATKHYIPAAAFNNKTWRLRDSHPLAGDINIDLQALELQYQRKLLKIEARIQDIPIKDLIAYLTASDKLGQLNFIATAQERAAQFQREKRDNSARLLEKTTAKIKQYTGQNYLPFAAITQKFLKGFETWYNLTGSQNSAAIHLRNIRAVFNYAINERHLSPELYPFRKFAIRTERTIHRDITAEEIATLYRLPLSGFQATARDIWILSFFLIGINFKDLIQMPATCIRKDRIIYTRAKTRTIYSVKIEPEAQAIIDRYAGEKYVLRFFEDKQKAQQKKDRKTDLYKDITDRTNRALKKIAKAANKAKEVIDPQISTYYARHSWATIASRLDTTHDIIREALGHSRTVTDVYINFYIAKIDQANRRVIDQIIKSGPPAG